MPLAAGTRLGAYEILGPLGAGGMGEVYRARDTRLGRQVALKILPSEAAADPERLARFDREARTLAGLDHPGIVTIYAIEQADGANFIAMTLVDGQTLADALPPDGFPMARLLTIATQVADAVATAHRHGIVHRDLKPANIMVGAHDRVTVLDFGLAKLREAAPVDDMTRAPIQDVTGEGRIVGTVSYMSPEQAQGLAVDARSDVFSLGIVLHEMATGARPFSGDTSVAVLSAILKDTPPPLESLRPELPRDLARIVRRCLAKEPDRRYQSATDLRNDLEDLKLSWQSGELDRRAATVTTAPAVARLRPANRVWPAATAVMTIVALAAVAWVLLREPAEPPAVPILSFSQLTMQQDTSFDPVVSPDGRWVAYVAGLDGNFDIYLQSIAGRTPINLTKNAAADLQPAFSPDGERIAFWSGRDGGGLFVMGRTGESVRRLAPTGYTPAWFHDGRRIVYATLTTGSPETRGGGRSALWIADADGGEPRLLFAGDALQPRVSPNGRRIAFYGIQFDDSGERVLSTNRDIWTINADGTDVVRLINDVATDWNPVWSPDGQWIYFLSSRSGAMNLWRLPVDETTGRATGPMQPLQTPAPYIRNFSIAADGRTATYATLAVTSNLSRVRFNPQAATAGGPLERITTGRDFGQLESSVTGDRVLVGPSVRQQEDLYLMAPDGTGLVQLTNDPYKDRGAKFMPDGRRIVFYSDRGGHYDLWSIDRDGSGLRRLTTTDGRYWPVPSPDGSKVVASVINTFQWFVHDARDVGQPAEILPPLPDVLRGSTFIPTDWAPDGHAIVGVSNPHLWTYTLGTKQFQRIGDAGATAQWLSDSRRLLYAVAGRVVVVEANGTSQPREVFTISGEAISRAHVSADNWLYVLSGSASGDVWAVRIGEPDAAKPQP